MKKRAYRNPQDKVIAGVCTGLGEYFSIDPLFIRIIFLLFLFEPPIAIIGYIALWIALPTKPLDLPPMFTNEQSANQQQSNATFEQKVESFAKEAEQIGKEFGDNIESMAKKFNQTFEPKKTEGQIHVDINIGQSRKKSTSFAIILISLGSIFLAHNFIPDMDLEKYWPLILIGIGISILFSGRKEMSS